MQPILIQLSVVNIGNKMKLDTLDVENEAYFNF